MEVRKEGLCDQCTDPMDCGSWNCCFVEHREVVPEQQEDLSSRSSMVEHSADNRSMEVRFFSGEPI